MLDSARQLDDDIKGQSAFLDKVRSAIGEVIVGQEYMIERLLVGLLANGHVLLEGAPGLAKTLAVTTLAQTLHAQFQRIQFTPDLMPSDITGVHFYNQKSGEFEFRPGTIFAQVVLAVRIVIGDQLLAAADP